MLLVQAFDGVVALDHGDDDVVVACLQRAVHHHLVAVFDAGAAHGVAAHIEHEGGRFVAHQIVVEVEAVFGVVSSGRRKACRHAVQQQAQWGSAGLGLQALGLLVQGLHVK